MGICEGIAILVAVLSFTNLARKNVWSRHVYMGEGVNYPKGCGTPLPRTAFLQPGSHAATIVVAQILCDECLVCV